MDKTVIIKQIEFYSNTIVAFVVLQGMGYCYYFGTNELFNRLVKQTSDLSLGLLFILSCSLVFGSVATIYLRKQAEKLIDKPHHDLIRHLYLAKLLIVMLFGFMPVLITFRFAILKV